MKKSTLITSFAVVLALVSCKKNDTKMTSESYSTETTVTDENGKVDSVTTTSMEKEINGKKITSVSYPYKTSDGSRAKATFSDNGKSKTITIEANNMKYVLDFVKATPTGELYERNSISAESSEDSLLISQGNNIIHLGKIK
jgi:major membrane immunogen (membrane-anchored lipoprotein)